MVGRAPQEICFRCTFCIGAQGEGSGSGDVRPFAFLQIFHISGYKSNHEKLLDRAPSGIQDENGDDAPG